MAGVKEMKEAPTGVDVYDDDEGNLYVEIEGGAADPGMAAKALLEVAKHMLCKAKRELH